MSESVDSPEEDVVEVVRILRIEQHPRMAVVGVCQVGPIHVLHLHRDAVVNLTAGCCGGESPAEAICRVVWAVADYLEVSAVVNDILTVVSDEVAPWRNTCVAANERVTDIFVRCCDKVYRELISMQRRNRIRSCGNIKKAKL